MLLGTLCFRLTTLAPLQKDVRFTSSPDYRRDRRALATHFLQLRLLRFSAKVFLHPLNISKKGRSLDKLFQYAIMAASYLNKAQVAMRKPK